MWLFLIWKKRKSLTPCLKVLKQHIQLLRQKGPKNIIINYKLCNSSFGIRSQSTNSYTSVDNILVHIWIYICPHSTSVWSCSVKWRWWSNSNAEWHLVALGIRGHGMAGSWPSVHRYCIWWNSNLRERNTLCTHQFKMGQLSNFQFSIISTF